MFDAVSGVIGGSPTVLYDLTFCSNASGESGLSWEGTQDFHLSVTQLYYPPESSPEFALGNYAAGDDIITLAVVREASTWGMMLAGFAGLAFAGWRKAKGPAAIAA